MITQKEFVEQRLWAALEMDEFGESLVDANDKAPFFFGTGHTVNSCYQCDNSHSACTSGESGCNRELWRKVANVIALRMTH